MATSTRFNGSPRGNFWRPLIWGGACLLLLIPAVSMQLGERNPGFNWGLGDFIAAGVMLFGACGAFELAARTSRRPAYLLGAAVGIGTGLFLLWSNLAVGVLGDEGNRANLMFAAVLAIASIGTLVARFRPAGMTMAMLAAASAQTVAAIAAFFLGFGWDTWVAAMFVPGWALSAALFGYAARQDAGN